ncbi:hypothetical protein LCGC14_0967180 [marine sediment metagenome]|uniref:Uncharacterized protein n=1 Tax=marine sediment metagenome TaxID=412755 RepID=A0A0F9NH84_9ZZZZ
MAKASVLYITEDRLVRKKRMSYLGEWLFDSNAQRGWFTLRKFFINIKGRMGVPIDERWAMPVSPYREDKYDEESIRLRTDVTSRISQAIEVWKNMEAKEGRLNVLVWGVTIVVTCSVLVFLVMAVLIASGKVQL